MDGPPGVACMDTRHPRRLLAPEQVLMRFSIIYDRPSIRLNSNSPKTAHCIDAPSSTSEIRAAARHTIEGGYYYLSSCFDGLGGAEHPSRTATYGSRAHHHCRLESVSGNRSQRFQALYSWACEYLP